MEKLKPIKKDKIPPDGRLGINSDIEMSKETLEAIKKEKSMEEAKRVLEEFLKTGNLSEPLFIHKTENSAVEFTRVRVEKDENGAEFYLVPKYDIPEENYRKKKRLVKNIMKNINKVLRNEIGLVTEIALLRKPQKQLENLSNNLKNSKDPPRLKNRIGCIFLEIGDEEVQI